jgi:hypothetical protein
LEYLNSEELGGPEADEGDVHRGGRKATEVDHQQNSRRFTESKVSAID